MEFVKESLVFSGEDSPMANLTLSIMGAFAEIRTLPHQGTSKERHRPGQTARRLQGPEKMEVRAELAARRMTQAELADAIGTGPDVVNRYLVGHRSMTSRTFIKIAEALGLRASVPPSSFAGPRSAWKTVRNRTPRQVTVMAPMSDLGKSTQAAIVTQIKAEMAAKDWTQADSATAVGMATSTLSRYLGGVRDVPIPVFEEMRLAPGAANRGIAGPGRAPPERGTGRRPGRSDHRHRKRALLTGNEVLGTFDSPAG